MKHGIKRMLAVLLVMTLLVSCSPAKNGENTSDTTPSSQVAESSQAPEFSQTETTTEKTTEAPKEESRIEAVAAALGLEFDHEEELQYANKFTLTHYKDGYKIFTTSNDDKKVFVIVPEGKDAPETVPEHTYILKQPLNKVHLVSSIIAGYFNVLDGLDTVVTTSKTADKWFIPEMKEKVESGAIKFAGKYSEPDFEMLTSMGIDLEIDTTMLNSKPEIMQKYDELGIPVVVDTSSKENHPLGRVEWIKLMGALLDKEDEAQAYFDSAVEKVKNVTTKEKTGKTVVMFLINSKNGSASVRNGGDYMAKMIELAGGTYLMADMEPEKSGATKMNLEELYARAMDADYIFYYNLSTRLMTLDDLIQVNDLFKDFKAVKEGRVYTTSPSYSQDMIYIANIIEDMNTVLNDDTVEDTGNLKKLK